MRHFAAANLEQNLAGQGLSSRSLEAVWVDRSINKRTSGRFLYLNPAVNTITSCDTHTRSKPLFKNNTVYSIRLTSPLFLHFAMRPSRAASPLLILLTHLVASTLAIQALSDSPCASKCGNVLSSTSGPDDISCYDSDYQSTSKAKVFQNCITCQLESKYVDPRTRQTDLQWALCKLLPLLLLK